MEPKTITKYDIQKYIMWILNESNSPYDEIEWLVQYALKGDAESSKNLITSLIKTITKQ